MSNARTRQSISRRTALAGLGAGGIGLALAANVRHASAQDTAADMANHPIVGTWLVAPRDPSGSHDTILFGADGSVVQGWAASAAGPQGATLSGSGLGVWEPTGPRTAAFTAVTVNSDAAGANLGTFTLDGHLEVGEDGQTWVDSGELSIITLRDTAGAVVQEIPTAGAPPVTAVRMRVKAPGFPASSSVATPTP